MILYWGRGGVDLPVICIDNSAFICAQKGEKLYPGIRYIMDYNIVFAFGENQNKA